MFGLFKIGERIDTGIIGFGKFILGGHSIYGGIPPTFPPLLFPLAPLPVLLPHAVLLLSLSCK